MEKINIAELLKDCQKGMELDCVLNDNVTFECILDGNSYPIQIQTPEGNMRLSQYGCMSLSRHAKCVIFPKGKTTWEGFVPPCKFEDGDIVFSGVSLISIFKGIKEGYVGSLHSYVSVGNNVGFNIDKDCWTLNNIRLATEEEKARLFQAIKDNGYKWNPETKTLEKLIEPKFHEGDWVVTDYGKVNQVITVSEDGEGFTLDDGSYFSGSWKDMYHLWTIQDAKEGDVLASDNGNIILVKESRDSSWGYRLSYHCAVLYNGTFESREFHVSPENFLPATKEQRELLFQKMKEAGHEWNEEIKTLEKLLKFKVGDRIKHKGSGLYCTLGEYSEGISAYRTNIGLSITSTDLEHWELFPNKFDITTLIPFESKVLVRNDNEQRWIPAFWGYKRDDGYTTTFGWSKYCVPFDRNENLLGTTNDCEEFYKTWK